MNSLRILALETSCDDTSVAVVQHEPGASPRAMGCISVSQKNLHQKFGGIVPENASRAHLEVLDLTVGELLQTLGLSLADMNAIAVTHAPGLLGSLLVGVSYAQGLAGSLRIPCWGVHHLEGHLSAPFLSEGSDIRSSFPALGMVVSGGHTHMYLMREWANVELVGHTLDDAVGECFDKSARLLGLEYPGGPELNRLAHEFILERYGDASCIPSSPLKKQSSFDLPRPKPGGTWEKNGDMSFSGLKTAVRLLVEKKPLNEAQKRDLAFGLHEAIGEVLIRKVSSALERHPEARSVILTGGVSANSIIRHWFKEHCRERGIICLIPEMRYCTDNAAMIGAAASMSLQTSRAMTIASDASPSCEIGMVP